MDPKEDSITEDHKKDPISDNPKEESITEDPKKDPKEYPTTGDSK